MSSGAAAPTCHRDPNLLLQLHTNSSADGEVWVTLWVMALGKPSVCFQHFGFKISSHTSMECSECPWVLCQMRVEGDLSAGWKKYQASDFPWQSRICSDAQNWAELKE